MQFTLTYSERQHLAAAMGAMADNEQDQHHEGLSNLAHDLATKLDEVGGPWSGSQAVRLDPLEMGLIWNYATTYTEIDDPEPYEARRHEAVSRIVCVILPQKNGHV